MEPLRLFWDAFPASLPLAVRNCSLGVAKCAIWGTSICTRKIQCLLDIGGHRARREGSWRMALGAIWEPLGINFFARWWRCIAIVRFLCLFLEAEFPSQNTGLGRHWGKMRAPIWSLFASFGQPFDGQVTHLGAILGTFGVRCGCFGSFQEPLLHFGEPLGLTFGRTGSFWKLLGQFWRL